MNVEDAILYRFKIIQNKLTGRLPALPWIKLAAMIASPVNQWDCSYFAIPVPGQEREGLVLYDTAFGRFYGRPKDRQVIGFVIAEEMFGIYSRPSVAVRPGDIVLDLGAHMGTFTRVALDAGAKLVVSFEADSDNARCFRQTFQAELASGKVILVESPVWSESCIVHFAGDQLAGQISDHGTQKQAVTIDEIVSKFEIPRVDFIKTDIEGAERHALRGASKALGAFAPRMVISSYHLPDDPAVLSEIIRATQPYKISYDGGQQRMFCHVN